MMMTMKLAPLFAALVLLAGCTASPSPQAPTASPHVTATPASIADTRYESVADLKDAVVALGYTCGSWEQDNAVKMAAESGQCSSSDSFAIFESYSEVMTMSSGYDELTSDGSLNGVSGFFGKNWVVLMPIEEADRFESAIGAMRLDPPDAEEMLANFSAEELSYAEAEETDTSDPDEVASAVELGREICGSLEDAKTATSQAFTMLGDESDYYLGQYATAIKYLCPKYQAALKMAERGFTDGEYDISSKAADDKIRPGTYRTEKGIRDCYWSRLTKHGSIIDNDFISYASAGARVTIRSSDGGFKVSGCGAWLPVG